jgi:mono/diheme cytochrome c family protein
LALFRAGEVGRVSSRFLGILLAGALGLAGCSDAMNAGPVLFGHDDRLQNEEFAKKPKLRKKVIDETNRLFGASPRRLRVPAGSGLPDGGLHLGNRVELGDAKARRLAAIAYIPSGRRDPVFQEGGHALYRRHCLHCHGVSGDGDGPTANYLFPPPRDFRLGTFKFTSTAVGAKPTRADLRKTILHGLPGTSMPSFEALMTGPEIEQVLDFVIFLSMRGEVQRLLVEEALISDENDPAALAPEIVQEYATVVFEKWKAAEAQVVAPETPRVPSTPESIRRGRALFLNLVAEQQYRLDCMDCHGPRAQGNGSSFVDPAVFDQYVFGGDPGPGRVRALKQYAEAKQKKWADDWGDPLRPANLNLGVYKGGRRPIDLYWRVTKGINGTPMPAHTNLKPEMIWDLVNFLLALPYQPELLRDAPAAPAPAPAAVARR